MSKKSTAWFFEDPMDLEYKKYKLLANVEFAEKSLNEGNIHDAMDFIEDHLVCFYRFQTDQEIRQIGDSEIIGVDPIMMDLIYEKGKKDTREDIKITFQKEVDYNKDFVMDFVNSLKEKTSDLIFINASLNKECQSKRAIDFVLACKVYYKLQKDFLF
jgi:hypothetical protein